MFFWVDGSLRTLKVRLSFINTFFKIFPAICPAKNTGLSSLPKEVPFTYEVF
jgi:hypothetical protein